MRPVNPMRSKVAVQSEDSSEIPPLGDYHQRSIREIHWRVMILPHKNLHPFPFPRLWCMQDNQAVSQITPQFLLSGQASRTPEGTLLQPDKAKW